MTDKNTEALLITPLFKKSISPNEIQNRFTQQLFHESQQKIQNHCILSQRQKHFETQQNSSGATLKNAALRICFAEFQ